MARETLQKLAREPFDNWTTEQLEILLSALAVGHADRSVALLVFQSAIVRHKTSVRNSLSARLASTARASAFDAFAAATSLDPRTASEWLDDAGLSSAIKSAIKTASDSDPLALDGYALAFANLASVLAVQPQLRQLVSGSMTWLDSAMSSSDARVQALSALTILILRLSTAKNELDQAEDTLEELTVLFVSLLHDSKEEATVSACLEGLSYVTMSQAKYRAVVGTRSVLDSLRPKINSPAFHYPASLLLLHLSHYQDVDSAQSRLRQYASAQKDKQETHEAVDARIAELQPSMLPILQLISSSDSRSARRNVGTVCLNMASQPKLRPAMLAAGAAKSLDSIIRSLAPPIVEQDLDSIHALARLLITANPSLVFNDLVAPARALLMPLGYEGASSSGQTDLRTFEVLMALTNIASLPPRLQSDAPPAHIIASTPVPVLSSTTQDAKKIETTTIFTILHDLMIHDRPLVQRAAVELVCNLASTPEGIAFFVPSTSSASNRLQLLLALTSAQDRQTRLAAGGSLAIMIEHLAPSFASQLAENAGSTEKARSNVELLVNLLDDADDGDMLARATHIWEGILTELQKRSSEERSSARQGLARHDLQSKLRSVGAEGQPLIALLNKI